jgi:MSHA biogenesis protein MshL
MAQAQGQGVPPPPGQAQQPPEPLRPLVVTQLDERQRLSDLDSNRTFSLTFAEPTPITDLLLLLVRDTNLSVVPDPDVQGTFRGELKDVTLRQALELIVQPSGLDSSVEGNLIRVFKRRLETRIFDLNFVVTRRSGARSLAASSGTGGGAVTSVLAGGGTTTIAEGTSVGAPLGSGSSAQVSGMDGGDLFADLAIGMQTLLSPDGKFNMDRKAALLQVTDYPDRLDKVGLYLDAVQTRASRQVQIQARVIEVELRDEFAAGIDWKAVIESAGESVAVMQTLAPSTSGGFTASLDIRDFSGLVKAFATQGRVNVVASPRVNAMNNEPAIMRIGTQNVFFVTTSQIDATTGRILQTTVTPQPITEGVVLSVTPQVGGDGMINMSISPSITERTGEATSRFGDTVPIMTVREADTLVRVHENETIVIAGLMQERVTRDQGKVPLLGDLPVVGGLFRRNTRSSRKTDLVILLTPTIMTPGRAAENAASEQERLSQAKQASERR